MKVVLAFEAEEHEADGLKVYQDGPAWKAVCRELDEWLRGQVKYAGRQELQEVRERLREILESERLILD